MVPTEKQMTDMANREIQQHEIQLADTGSEPDIRIISISNGHHLLSITGEGDVLVGDGELSVHRFSSGEVERLSEIFENLAQAHEPMDAAECDSPVTKEQSAAHRKWKNNAP